MAEQKPKDPTKKEKVWTKLNKGAECPNEQPVLADFFQKKGKMMNNKRYFAIYGNIIYYFGEKNLKEPKGMTELSFDLKFEVIREKVEKKDVKNEKPKLGKAKGIKFDKGPNCVCELYSQDEATVLKWRDFLRNRINQRGFHDLFRAHKKIGKGNFASVYLAERIEDEQLFAVKAFSKEAAYAQDKGKEALVNEIDLMRALDHPNIIKLHEVFETENSLYMILDLLEGGQLYDKVKAKYRFTLDEAKQILKGLINGLNHMHERGIMHRDLKPENILFKKANNTEVVIVDLGLATRANEKEYLFVRCGTPGFVAPEVVNIKDLNVQYDPVCDIFSVGLIFHILLIGRSPFNGKTYNEILSQNRASNIKLDGHEFLRLPLTAYDLLKKTLEKEPKKRITAHDAANHKFFSLSDKEKEKQAEQKEKKKVEQSDFDDGEEEVVDEGNEGAIENHMSQFHEQRAKFDMAKINNHQMSPQMMPSPALISRPLKRTTLELDSCASFKMSNSPVLTGRVDSVSTASDSVGGFDSPGCFLQSDKSGRTIKSSFANSPLMQSKNLNTPQQMKKSLLQGPQILEEEEKQESSPKFNNNNKPNDIKQAAKIKSTLKNFDI